MLSSPLVDLALRAVSDADRPLLVEDESMLSFAKVHRDTLVLGSFLRLMDVRKGDRVAVLMSKTHKQAIAQLGIMAAGGVFVPISDLLKQQQVEHILRDCGVKAVIVDYDKVDRLGVAASSLKVVSAGGEVVGAAAALESILKADLVERMLEIIGQDNAAIIYTSGSTGLPKGIVLSHRNLWDGARIVSTYLGLNSSDRLAQVLSLNFDYGLNQLFSAIRVGAALHFATFHFPKDLLTFLRVHEITTLALMPVFLNRLFDPRFFKSEFTAGIQSLRRITTSGGRVPLPIVKAIRAGFPKTDLYLMYGLTEAFRSTYLPSDQIDIRPTSIGRAIPDAQMMVLDENGKECPPETPGELVHRGGVISKGYWNAPEKTAERFKSWIDISGNQEVVVYSGDIVRRDAEGFLYFIGRRDNMIKTSGHRVSPEEIERAAEQMAGVEHAVAFGREHDVLGEEIVLVCITKEATTSLDPVEVKAFLRERVAAYMIPHHILTHVGFEVTPGNQGKVDRNLVKQRAIAALSPA